MWLFQYRIASLSPAFDWTTVLVDDVQAKRLEGELDRLRELYVGRLRVDHRKTELRHLHHPMLVHDCERHGVEAGVRCPFCGSADNFAVLDEQELVELKRRRRAE
jgi:hypothetical protein